MQVISSRTSNLSKALKPHLPQQETPGGTTVDQLTSACDAYTRDVRQGVTPEHQPYPDSMSRQERLRATDNLSEVAAQAQSDFAAQTSGGASLKTSQLQTSMSELEAHSNEQLQEASQERSQLKKDYYVQVGKTVAWMAGTAGALVVGGVLTGPLALIAVGALATATIRSIGKSRQAHKRLSQTLPLVDQTIQTQKRLLSDLVPLSHHLGNWDAALSPGENKKAA